ncbi:Branched-chain-amino-acid aminotransferase, cytosolic, partial [Ophiophagus hannah]
GCQFLKYNFVLFSSLFSPQADDLVINPSTTLKEKPDPNGLVFGTVFTDNMLFIEWSFTSGWDVPQIKPLENLSVHPAISALHYAVELFEGMKAYRGVDGKIRLFRPRLNMDRMLRSAARATLPVRNANICFSSLTRIGWNKKMLGFDKEELLQCIQKLVEVEKEWVPYSTSASLYIRPTLIGTEVGRKNYGSSIYAQREAMELGCQQVLWLYGDDHQITEVGTMNLFLYWRNEDGEDELATPPLDGIILPGVTRQSILDLARKWNLRIPTMENGPQIATRFWNQLSDIQYGGLLHSFHRRGTCMEEKTATGQSWCHECEGREHFSLLQAQQSARNTT